MEKYTNAIVYTVENELYALEDYVKKAASDDL